MKNRIRKLDKAISNKIAAGEVVERPASVVKELLENSIDADASSITIEIKDAGKSYIRVSDNGIGIHHEDISLAFERHATSKIYSDDQIYNIKSLGFRGEALASIGSVSNIEIITKTSDDEYGIKAELMNGEIIRSSSIGCPKGTTIVVKDLFYNTPARHKFLKSNSTETNYISSIVNNIALSHPEISFRYIVNNRNVFTTQGNNDLYSTIYTIYGRDVARNLIEIDFEDDNVTLRGFITNTSYTRGNRQLQICFVNGRYVKSRLISSAVDGAYKTLIPQNRFPICFLYLDIPTNKVDVNIHPAKTEIRFRDEKRIYDFIYNCIKEKLLSSNLIPNVNISNSNTQKKEERLQYLDLIKENKEKTSKESNVGFNIKQNDSLIKSNLKDDVADEEYQHAEKKEYEYDVRKNENNINDNNAISEEEMIGEIFNEIFLPKQENLIDILKNDEYSNKDKHRLDDIRIIGQLFATYIVCEKGNEMLLIDQHAAHERILYEKFMDNYINSEVLSQILLEPIIIELNYIDKDIIMGNKNIFNRLGYKIEEFGYNTIILREVPILFGAPVAKKFFMEIVENLNSSIKNGYEFKIEKIIQKSCKHAIKAADKLENIEIEKLIDDLKKLENSFTCPHGRPIVISISKAEIEKKFLRV